MNKQNRNKLLVGEGRLMVTQMGQVMGGWVEKVDGIKKYKSPVIKTVPGCEVRHEEHGQ